MVIIKRYPNRKMYDTTARQYITLEGIADLIRQSQTVQVLDYVTGEDLTALTLSQIIFEQEKKQKGFLPQTVLAGLVAAGGDTLTALRKSLISPLNLLGDVDEEIRRRLRYLVGEGELAAEEGTRLQSLLTTERVEEEPEWPGELYLRRFLAGKGIPTRAQIEALAGQIDALNAEVDALIRKKKAQ